MTSAAVRRIYGMRSAIKAEWLAFAVVVPLALLLVAVPALAVQVFLLLSWLVELLAWAVGGGYSGSGDRLTGQCALLLELSRWASGLPSGTGAPRA